MPLLEKNSSTECKDDGALSLIESKDLVSRLGKCSDTKDGKCSDTRLGKCSDTGTSESWLWLMDDLLLVSLSEVGDRASYKQRPGHALMSSSVNGKHYHVNFWGKIADN